MQPEIHKQEFVLVTAAFAHQHFQNTNKHPRTNRAPGDVLEEACWNGMLDTLLGSIVERSASGKRLGLSQVRQGDEIVEVELCNYPHANERHLSVCPYNFMYDVVWN